MRIIDAHIHCGNNRATKAFDIAEVRANLAEAGAVGAVLFAFPEDMYRLVDTPESRRRANEYVLEVAVGDPHLYPFYFVWNDYVIPDHLAGYAGIKWHRHVDEPEYDYEVPGCAAMVERIAELGLPVTLEESYTNTVQFVNRWPEVTVIIPHCGNLNGGYERMSAFYDCPQVYFDTSVAPAAYISGLLAAVGPERVIFGSDVSGTRQPFFNFTRVELEKFLALDLDDTSRTLVLAGNIERLVRRAEGVLE
jgi:hypothetical protein